jgi:hypothetical protein
VILIDFPNMVEVYRQRETEPDVEARSHLREMNWLLAKLVETGGELPADIRQGLRAQIQAHLEALGLESLEDYAGLTAIYQRLYERSANLPTPPNYPRKDQFHERLRFLYDIRGEEPLPALPREPLVSDIAQFGQADWSEIEGRGGVGVVDYLYDLGKLMCSELAYSVAFDETDPIVVDSQWRVENGRHRALALRVLGSGFVRDRGMDAWVLVLKE